MGRRTTRMSRCLGEDTRWDTASTLSTLRRLLRSCDFQTSQQVRRKFVERDAVDFSGVDNHMLAPPLQSQALAFVHVLVSPDDKYTRVVNCPLAEACLAFVAIPSIL